MTTVATSQIDAVVLELRELLGDRIDRSEAGRAAHGRDESWHEPVPPDLVVHVVSTAEVVAVVKACAKHAVPVIPFGAGTGLEGHIAALHGGVSVDMSAMNEILRVDLEDLDCTVQAGAKRKELNERLQRDGVFFPIDPGADATLGGMAATRASGTNAVRYGTMRDNVLALTAVLADGTVVHTGTRARKSSSGYDLTRLLIGSEGTLAIITEVTVRLYGIPEVIGGATVSFASLHGAVSTVIQAIQLGVPVARIELLDEVMVAAINAYSELDLAEETMLLLEFHGSAAAVADQAETIRQLASENGGSDWSWSTETDARNRLWQARHDAYYAGLALLPGSRGVATDVCVPISKLADCILETRSDIERAGLLAPILGHVGDGNFHVVALFEPGDDEMLSRIKEFNSRLVHRALAMGGTSTGEHGIGHGKLQYMRLEHGAGVDVMRTIKQALDPQGILNPGKVIPGLP